MCYDTNKNISDYCKIFLIIVLSVCISCIAYAGDANRKLTLTLEDAISMAHDNSPEVQAARHTYRAAYWNYRSFRANYLPSVSLISNPYLNRQINKITQPDGTEQFIRQNKLSTDLGLQISQNVSFTGGNFFVQTSTLMSLEAMAGHITPNRFLLVTASRSSDITI